MWPNIISKCQCACCRSSSGGKSRNRGRSRNSLMPGNYQFGRLCCGQRLLTLHSTVAICILAKRMACLIMTYVRASVCLRMCVCVCRASKYGVNLCQSSFSASSVSWPQTWKWAIHYKFQTVLLIIRFFVVYSKRYMRLNEYFMLFQIKCVNDILNDLFDAKMCK